VRRTRATIVVLVLSLGLLGGYLAVLAQDAPWPPPPVRPLPRGTVPPSVVRVRDVPDPKENSQESTTVLSQEDPLPLEPVQEQKKPIEEQKKPIENQVVPVSGPGSVVVTLPDKEPAPAPFVDVREVVEPAAPKPPAIDSGSFPAPKPLPVVDGSATPAGLPLDPGPVRIIDNPSPPGLPVIPDLPPKHVEVKTVPAAPVHAAVPIRRHSNNPVPPAPAAPAAPVLQPDPVSRDSNAPIISGDIPLTPRVQAPLLTIEKHGPSSVTMGQPVHYEIIVRNVGMLAAQQVRVEDELPEKVRFLNGSPQPVFQGGRVVWNLEEIPAGGEQRLHLDLEPGTSGEISGQTSLVLTIGSQTQVTTSPLEVSITGPGRIAKEGKAKFKILLTNRSTRPLGNLTLHMQLPVGLVHPSGRNIEADVKGELAPGASKDFDLEVMATQPGRHTLLAILTVQGRQEASARANVFVGEQGLVLVQPATTRIQLDRPGELTVEVANFHTRTIKNLSVTATLPEGVEFQGANEGGLHRSGLHKVQWIVETLAPEETRTLTISVKGKLPGQFVNTVVAQAQEGLKAQVQGKVVVESTAQLTMKISHRDEPLEVGHETVYEIRVGNQGNVGDSAVQIVANVPDGMSPRNAEGPTAFRVQGQQVVFEPLSHLDPNSQVIFKVRAVAQSAGDRRFRVQLSSANVREPITREDRTMVYRDRD